MSNIYSLLVGINKYSNPRNNLRGCSNDVDSFKNYLCTNFKNEDLKIQILEDDKATKQNIIEAFSIFRDAKKDDICIFYFSGHGSKWAAPDFLKHHVPDGFIKSIVCHDSREKGKIDLLSLELAYLIWEATFKKDIQFIVITDCCHAGGVTKDEKPDPLKYQNRNLENGTNKFNVADLHIGTSIQDQLPENFKIKRGRHIHLAACRDKQKAIEADVNSQRKGIFTHFLLETLKSHDGEISYENLIRKTSLLVEKEVPTQKPQLFIVESKDDNRNFLSTTLDSGNILCEVQFSPDNGWVVNRGIVNSPLNRNTNPESKIIILENKIEIPLDKVYATYSTLQKIKPSGLEHSKIYNAHLLTSSAKHIAVNLDSIPEQVKEKLLKDYFKNDNKYSFVFSTGNSNVQVELKFDQLNGFTIEDNQNIATKFRKNITFSPEEYESLFTALNKIAKWKYLLGLSSTYDTSTSIDLGIELIKIVPSSPYQDDFSEVPVESNKLVNLEHTMLDGQDCLPQFKIKFTNHGENPIWISMFFLGDDYFITNKLLSNQMLNHKESVFASQKNAAGDLLYNIKVKLSEGLYKQGQKSTTEYLKIITATSEFDASYFNQSGIASLNSNREFVDQENASAQIQWQTHSVSLKISQD